MAPRGVDEFDPARLQAAMTRAGLESVQQLAAAAGLARQSASAILHGRRIPTAPTLRRLAGAVGVPPTELLVDGTDGIGALRRAAGLPQRQAADAAGPGLPRSSWAMLEAGRIATLGPRRAERLAAVLACT